MNIFIVIERGELGDYNDTNIYIYIYSSGEKTGTPRQVWNIRVYLEAR